ncbi:MAG TPA: hypothetical protein VGP68_19695, partial [Gemmataceae bacterium]|nr:hypothetical protein [Gemmataceae bacterium]
MNALVPITLFGWPLVVLLLFAKLPKHRAVIVAFLVAWLFLPVVHDPVLGLRWTKMRATCCSVVFASLCMDHKHFLSFRARLVDLPMLVWCISPFFSSLDNELGVYDGCSQSLDQFIAWGVPYLAGRLYLTTFDQLRDLAIGVIVSGLIYAPLCLFEIRVSPQLHTWVYGYFPHVSFFQTMRYGGFRPTVFMEHGLAVGAWMCTVTLTAFWLWRCRAFPQFRLWALRAPPILITSGLFFVLVLSKSFGAIGLGLAGALTLLSCSWSRLRIFALILLLVPLFYVYGRAVGG